MKALDTNVLVRYLVHDDEKQAEKASAFIRKAVSGGACFINQVVICELVWVLESAYNFTKPEISAVLEKMLITRQFEMENKDVLRHAVNDYRNGTGDISDYLIGRINRAHGCEFTATFDRALKASPFFELLD